MLKDKRNQETAFSALNTSYDSNPHSQSQWDLIYDYLINLLYDLEGIMQLPKYHPEGDTLFHSLQVFQCASSETFDPDLLAASLFHDIGKAIDYPNHARVGAELLSGIFDARICWLIEHHLDLLNAPARCRRKYAGTQRLSDLEQLRKWDLAGRQVHADVPSPQQALNQLKPYFSQILNH